MQFYQKYILEKLKASDYFEKALIFLVEFQFNLPERNIVNIVIYFKEKA